MCKLFIVLAAFSFQLALADSPKQICNVVGAWDYQKGNECNHAIRKCKSFDAGALQICSDMVYWDFKDVPSCLNAVCNSTFREADIKGCRAQAISDFHSAVSCLESASGA